ncbi:hypothetical protein FRZ44_08870 [Hypericibacter terrae]|uniref:Uncharacterized protein n=1 Tax=Hypericibacter terrae TaxID=2602015 RepID=A0A5J6MH39_9PROT|nr:hypothetical protein FRZ44_08870 [Hypericibacter terrae]
MKSSTTREGAVRGAGTFVETAWSITLSPVAGMSAARIARFGGTSPWDIEPALPAPSSRQSAVAIIHK